ncbi:MAG: hypothetical protein U9R25_17255 [Chloroflexota bacterium]|nr:hypothetical protein [Chloroflexota bacterium]
MRPDSNTAAFEDSQPEAILIVFLESGGRVEGVSLPPWASQLVDSATEAYARLAVRLQARRHYDRIIVLQHQQATETNLWINLLDVGNAIVDILMLVHGQTGYACGYANREVGADFFQGMRKLKKTGIAGFQLRAVYQMNCYGESLARDWLSLGAQAVNGSEGVNWLPEPSLSIFLLNWLGGEPFQLAVDRSYDVAQRTLSSVWRPKRNNSGQRQVHPKIASSRMHVLGDGDLTIS